jgi:hypothetical protein
VIDGMLPDLALSVEITGRAIFWVAANKSCQYSGWQANQSSPSIGGNIVRKVPRMWFTARRIQATMGGHDLGLQRA